MPTIERWRCAAVLNEIAVRLNCSPSFLHRHFPHLCKEISERRRLSKKNANGRQTVAGPTKEDLPFGATKGSDIHQQQNLLNGAGQKEKLDLSLVMSEVQPLQLHKRASRSRPSKSDIDRMERILRAILARDQSPPAMKEIAKTIGHSPLTIRKYFPDLYCQILNRRSVGLDIDHLRQSLDFVLSEREHPPTLVDIARKLGCSVRSLKRYFPMECKGVVARRNKTDVRHKDPDNLTRQERALDEALLSDEPLPLKTIAKSLGCHCKVLRRRFPELCQSIEERYEKSIDAGRIRKALEKALAHDNPPPSVSKIAKSLGYPDKILERYCPELCSAILERCLLRPDISNLKVNLEAILASAEDPISMSEVERRLGYSRDTIFNRFPELYSAISHKYQIFI